MYSFIHPWLGPVYDDIRFLASESQNHCEGDHDEPSSQDLPIPPLRGNRQKVFRRR